MKALELKKELQKWVDQIGVYNEGCTCDHCMGRMLYAMRKAMTAYQLREIFPDEHYENLSK